MCAPGDLPGPAPRRPDSPGSHGDLAGGCHNNLQASSERSRGADDGLETVTRAQTPSRCAKASHRAAWAAGGHGPRLPSKALAFWISDTLDHIHRNFKLLKNVAQSMNLCLRF